MNALTQNAFNSFAIFALIVSCDINCGISFNLILRYMNWRETPICTSHHDFILHVLPFIFQGIKFIHVSIFDSVIFCQFLKGNQNVHKHSFSMFTPYTCSGDRSNFFSFNVFTKSMLDKKLKSNSNICYTVICVGSLNILFSHFQSFFTIHTYVH